MKRIKSKPRDHWQTLAESLGFSFHSIGGDVYWDETAYYQFSNKQVEDDLETPTEELHEMCISLVEDAINNESLLKRLAIPETYWEYIAQSWTNGSPHLYGRMDLSYSGNGPAKLLELNYDTPTSLYESAFFQLVWLEQMIALGTLPAHADQFNSIQEKLTLALQITNLPQPVYFSAVKDAEEDQGTIAYFRDIAQSAGLATKQIAIEDIGLTNEGVFVDLDDKPIPSLFKLYPWEFIFEEPFGHAIIESTTCFIEPAWKAILSNKGILALLWEKFPNHPNLLPCFIAEDARSPNAGWVKKPFFSREGANIEICTLQHEQIKVDGPYGDGPQIIQRFHPLPKFEESYTLIGSWVVGDRAAGIGIREDNSLITKDTSRFLPHIILD